MGRIHLNRDLKGVGPISSTTLKLTRFFRRYRPVFYLMIVDVVLFLLIFLTKPYNFISITDLNQSLVTLMGITLGLTFTSFSILIGIVPVIDKRIKQAAAFKSIGPIILFATINEVVALALGLASSGFSIFSQVNRLIIDLLDLFFSMVSISLLVLISYYLFLTFSYFADEEESIVQKEV